MSALLVSATGAAYGQVPRSVFERQEQTSRELALPRYTPRTGSDPSIRFENERLRDRLLMGPQRDSPVLLPSTALVLPRSTCHTHRRHGRVVKHCHPYRSKHHLHRRR